MSSGIYDINIDQGSSFKLYATLMADDTTPTDLTGYSGVGQIRLKANDVSHVASFNVSIVDAVAGKIEVTLTPAQTSVIPTKGNSYSEKMTYVYDIYLVNQTDKIRVLNGKALVSPTVTK